LRPSAVWRHLPTKARQGLETGEGWSERLKAAATLVSPDDVDADIQGLLKQAWERS